MREHSRSHSRSASQHKQCFDIPSGYAHSRENSINSLLPRSERSTRTGSIQSDSTDRGRTMQRRYEFIDSDDKTNIVLSPVHETTKEKSEYGNNGNASKAGHESNMTTMTDLMQQCMEYSPPLPPIHTNHLQQQINGDIYALASELSLTESDPKTKRRPTQLNLRNNAYVGMVNRNTNRYQVEHNAIQSSKAEQFDLYPANGSSPVYDSIRDGPNISPLNIPKRDTTGISSTLQSYTEWRENMKLAHTTSQGSISITIPTQEEDEFMAKTKVDGDHRQKIDCCTVRDVPIVNHVRSRSALGIRADGNKDNRHHQFPAGSAYSVSEYSAPTHTGQGPALARSATMHEVPHRDRQYSDGSETKISRNGTLTNDVAPHKETVIPPSPYTPLTPFIMRVSGAPAGVEQGGKVLFGEHGWLEDTAALGAKKPKIEKSGGFMENLKRKAREIADSTAFKPARNNYRANFVNRINISLNAREQSLLYCELEYNLNNALDAYFKAQLNSGRLDASKLSRIADAWAQKGRPKVIGFRYDLETQVDLITAHINEFRFYGPVQAEGPAAIAGLLYAMKTNARYMRIRTFCQPDSVIAKHVLDAQNLLRLLGSPESSQRPLEEVAQFFKVAVDRRKAMAEMPAPRQGGGRDINDGSARNISNGSAQRVRFQEGGERRRAYGQMPAASKSRPDLREGNNGTVKSRRGKPAAN
ncbi:hypothetical protein F5Y09DRAFT_317383 [Xylaria sp. FL1042]|nr:hypothetical protein F5Y09DRAFT_317383 [Xylaria sp. FL1042]